MRRREMRYRFDDRGAERSARRQRSPVTIPHRQYVNTGPPLRAQGTLNQKASTLHDKAGKFTLSYIIKFFAHCGVDPLSATPPTTRVGVAHDRFTNAHSHLQTPARKQRVLAAPPPSETSIMPSASLNYLLFNYAAA
ncbi:hypothetical protein PUN28_003366 [Cardiocondyla obscurior]|uniref:Uncharacterized protein n=1 Tax=Cardiocondyla obscurior TaxID=286306 RepID=A0AAW2GIM8_9HYME